MEKKPLYIPTEEDIYNLEKIKRINDINRVDIYSYLIAKCIEKIINDSKYLHHANKEILELPGIVHGICWLYPQEIYNSEYVKYDADLCNNLLTKVTDSSIHNLDNLNMFSLSVQYNRIVMSTTINELDKKLINNPKYRFEYRDSLLLDSIFGVDYEKFDSLSYSEYERLINIDPIYALKLNPKKMVPGIDEPDERIINHVRGSLFDSGLTRYMMLYNLSPFLGYKYDKIDMTNPQDENVKKLIKYLHS